MPKIILISGPSAAGKTTLTQYLAVNFEDEYEHIRQDDYLKDPKTFPIQGNYQVWEDPGNIMFELLVEHVKKLKNGEMVHWRTFAKDENETVHKYVLKPKPFIVVEGTLLLTNEALKELADRVIYLDVPLEVSLTRRAERGKLWNLVLDEYDKEIVIPALLKYQNLIDEADKVLDGTKTTKELALELQSILGRETD